MHSHQHRPWPSGAQLARIRERMEFIGSPGVEIGVYV